MKASADESVNILYDKTKRVSKGPSDCPRNARKSNSNNDFGVTSQEVFKTPTSNKNQLENCATYDRMCSRYSYPHRKSAYCKCGKLGRIRSVDKSTIPCKLVHSDRTQSSVMCHDLEPFSLIVRYLNQVTAEILVRVTQKLF